MRNVGEHGELRTISAPPISRPKSGGAIVGGVDAYDGLVAEIAGLCAERGVATAAVESLTSGAVARMLGRGDNASDWFRGAVIAYQTATKERALGLVPGTDPCSPSCAAQLAAAGLRLLGADICVSVTGVGGPDPSGGHPPGEVHIGVATARGVTTQAHRFHGSAAEVVEQSTHGALIALRDALARIEAPAPHDDDEAGILIEPLRASDAGEILTIQRAAFVSEAQIYGSADTAPLTQTLEQLEAELETAGGWVARRGGRLVGALRTREADGVLLIGRIAIAPDVQGEGIGRRLLSAAEASSVAAEAELFTGSLSEANIRLYRDCGYEVTERVDQGDGTAQVFMRKRLSSPATTKAGEEIA